MSPLPEASMEITAGAFQAVNEADKKLHVQFHYHPHLNQQKSAEQARPIYDDRVYVMIMVPGDKDSIVHRAAWQKDFDRFPDQYSKFLNKQDQTYGSGTPLKVIPWLSGSQIKELEFFNCFTVEQLANMADAHAAKFMGLQSLKAKAKDFLEAAKGAAPMVALREEIEKKDSELKAANEQITSLAQRLQRLEEAQAQAKVPAAQIT